MEGPLSTKVPGKQEQLVLMGQKQLTTAQPVICSHRDGQKWPQRLFKKMQFFERPIQGLTLQSWFCATYSLEEVGFETFPVSVLSRYLSLGNISVSQCAAMGF